MYDQFRNPEPPRFSAIGGARELVFESLRRTPIGLRAKARLEALFSGGMMTKKLEFAITDELIADGRGDTQDLTSKIVITICDKAAIEDRMFGWSQAEILNVVGFTRPGTSLRERGTCSRTIAAAASVPATSRISTRRLRPGSNSR